MNAIQELRNQLKAENITDHLPFLLFIMCVGIVYIYNNHQADNMLRDINKTKTELKELKWKYLETKNDLENRSIQTKVAEAVTGLGLKELTAPPKKLVMKIPTTKP
jgi:hypothetical protein